jgi:mannose-6-phosphate isomerase class I
MFQGRGQGRGTETDRDTETDRERETVTDRDRDTDTDTDTNTNTDKFSVEQITIKKICRTVESVHRTSITACLKNTLQVTNAHLERVKKICQNFYLL